MMTMMALVKSTNPFMKRDNRVVAQIISDMQQQLLLLFICGNLATFQLLHTRGMIDYRRELSAGNNFPPQPWAARLLRTPKGGISHGSAKILISLEQALRASEEVLEPSQYAFPWKFLSQTGTHTGWKQEFCSIRGELHYLPLATNILMHGSNYSPCEKNVTDESVALPGLKNFQWVRFHRTLPHWKPTWGKYWIIELTFRSLLANGSQLRCV